jgi:hypothetical protein
MGGHVTLPCAVVSTRPMRQWAAKACTYPAAGRTRLARHVTRLSAGLAGDITERTRRQGLRSGPRNRPSGSGCGGDEEGGGRDGDVARGLAQDGSVGGLAAAGANDAPSSARAWLRTTSGVGAGGRNKERSGRAAVAAKAGTVTWPTAGATRAGALTWLTTAGESGRADVAALGVGGRCGWTSVTWHAHGAAHDVELLGVGQSVGVQQRTVRTHQAAR